MKQLRKYMVYMEDEDYVYKVAVPAEDEQAARDYVNGNGDVILIKDITEAIKITTENVSTALKKYDFSQTQTDFIVRTLQATGITE
ncbi:hypothetical protein [Filifactor alocis]